jgi:hypothetical protein
MNPGFRTLILTGMAMLGSVTYGQSLLFPRAVGMGAYGSSVKDSRAFTANPAGLVNIRDWDFSTATYTGVSTTDRGFVFHGLTFGKRFLEREALAVQYAPGASLTLTVPPTLSISGSNTPATNDREITYEEPFAIGFAHAFSTTLAVGILGRLQRQKVMDTQFEIAVRDTSVYPVTSKVTYEASAWSGEAGITWKPSDHLVVSVVGRNLIRLGETLLPDAVAEYRLSPRRSIELSAAYLTPAGLRLVGELSSSGSGALGGEWTPGYGLAFRGAVYGDRKETPFLCAVGISAGWSYEFIELDASYLRFTSERGRSGAITAADFNPGNVTNIDLNPYTRDRISLSIRAMFGNVREILARIEYVEMYGAVYPSSFEVFAYRPIGKARVRNISAQPIQARASFFVEKFMDMPTESQAVTILPGGVADIELTAVFNDRVKNVSAMTIRDASVYASATPAEMYDDRAPARVTIRGKNDWDGSVESLRFFVQPDDPDVLRASRDMLLQNRETKTGPGPEPDAFIKARTIINTFAGKLMYVNDPKQSADFVQYPAETLRLRGGDCDDMSVCFASLLSSIGISTAFVDVVPPGAPEKNHIYLLFDTGLDPKFGTSISDNPKRYVIRKSKAGMETIWVPLETTVAARGFDEAWTGGAQKYFDDVEVGLGLARRWVRIVDVN